MRVIDTLTRATKAAILRTLAAEHAPRQAMARIAAEHGVGVADLHALVTRHGYPNQAAMARHADEFERAAGVAVVEPPAPSPPAPPDVPESAEPEPDVEWVTVAVADLRPDRENLRDDVGDVTELAESITAVGLLQPIVARRDPDGALTIVMGHRRHAALTHLGWTSTTVVVRPAMDRDGVIAAMLVENGQRRDLDYIEVARGLRYLRDQTGETHAALGARIGKSQVFVSERLVLLNLSVEDQAMLRAGRLKLSSAIRKARTESGTIRASRNGRSPNHLSVRHPLAAAVTRRCHAEGHSTAGSMSIGGVGCGECWEAVIRADERAEFHAHAARTGACPVCDGAVTTTA